MEEVILGINYQAEQGILEIIKNCLIIFLFS